VHFGLGHDSTIEELRVEWPSGAVQELRQVLADQVLTVREHEAVTPFDPPAASGKLPSRASPAPGHSEEEPSPHAQ
jgi:ASPIC and UnbV